MDFTPRLIFESEIPAELERGGELQLVAAGDKATGALDGWYLMVKSREGEHKMLVDTRHVKARLTKTIQSVLKTVHGWPGIESLNVPLIPTVESAQEVWAYQADLNKDFVS